MELKRAIKFIFISYQTWSNRFKSFIRYFLFKNFRRTLVTRVKSHKTIPIIIVSFNQLFYLKKLIHFLKHAGYKNIIILDNASTYPPLINYLEEIKDQVVLFRLKKNYGHLVFWKKKEFFLLYGQNYYVVTDPDVVPEKSCPEDFLKYFKDKLNENKDITKVGFSLKIDDIPESNINRDKVVNWEKQFWEERRDDGNYTALIDTTFALYRPKYFYHPRDFFIGIRTKKPYQARHGGWYLDINNLTEEQKYYYDVCNESSAWRIDSRGQLKNSKLK